MIHTSVENRELIFFPTWASRIEAASVDAFVIVWLVRHEDRLKASAEMISFPHLVRAVHPGHKIATCCMSPADIIPKVRMGVPLVEEVIQPGLWVETRRAGVVHP